MDRHFAAFAAAILVASLLFSLALAEDAPVDVCPANSAHKTLPFLKTIKPGALGALLTNGMSIDMTAVTEFAKTTLIPVIGANVFFFALAALLLLIFILWRLLRWCCVVCCCRGGCDLRRSKHDPGELLFGKRMKINKGFMYLFGLVAVAFAVYGLATVDKNITDGAFNVLTTISDYATGAFDTLDAIINTIKGTTDIIDDFQAIVTVDIEVDAVITNLTAIGTFLATPPTPATIKNDVSSLGTRVNTDLTNAINQLQAAFAALPDQVGTATGQARYQAIQAAYTTLLPAIKTALDNLDGSLGSTGSSSDTTGVNKATLTTDLNAIDISGWDIQLNTLDLALLNGVGTNNPFTVLKDKVAAVKTIATDVTVTMMPALEASLLQLNTNYNDVSPKMDGLLVKLGYINATIMQLPQAMQDAYANLKGAKTQMDSAMTGNPSPTTLASDLATFRTTMPGYGNLDTLTSDLTSAEGTLQDVTNGFGPADTLTYRGWIATVRASLQAMTAPLGPLKDAVNGYNPASGDWGNDVWNLQSNLRSVVLMTARNSFTPGPATPAVNVIAQAYATKAGNLAAQGSGGPSVPATGSASTTANDILANIAALPSTTNLVNNLDDVDTAYTALGTPPEAVVDEPKHLLQTIKDAAITNGDNIKSSILSTVNGFQGSTSSMREMVGTQVTDIKAKYQEPAKTYDGYRYTASMALYGVSILFVALVVAASLANYHFGTNFSTILLLIITILYFLLALIIALLIAALYMGCNEMEPLAVKLAPAQFTPLLRYYFYNEGASVTAVLKDAGLVDIGAVRGQVEDSKSQVVSQLTGQFTWRDNPSNPRNPYVLIERINNTIDTTLGYVDTLLDKAGREEMFKVYSEVKGYICCAVPDLVTPMWTGLTMAGVFAVALIICTFFYISKIDHAPRKDCCGCTCHTRSKYAGSVHPNGEALPQFATPGWEQTPGYEAPNGAMAMHVPWIAGPEHGMVNVVVAGPGGVPKAKGI